MPRLIFPRRSVTLAVLASAVVVSTLSGCAAAPITDTAASPAASREAGVNRASRMCIVNGTDKPFPSVHEFEMTRTGSSNPDSPVELAPGAQWCTNGYNAFLDSQDRTVDATAEVVLSSAEADILRFEVANPAWSDPWMRFGYTMWSDRYFAPSFTGQWEIDLTLPDSTLSGPRHQVHLRRADDSSDYKEWVVTIKS